MRILLIVVSVALMAAAQAPATTFAGRKAWMINGAGTTMVTTEMGGEKLTVEIHVWQVPVDDRDSNAPQLYTQCTYTENPCRITDWIHVRIGEKELWSGRYEIAGLGDMHYLSVAGSPARLVLIIVGGDAAESYEAHLIFNGQHAVERILYPGIDPTHPFEVTHYYYGGIGQ